jgi:hypothetical protein
VSIFQSGRSNIVTDDSLSLYLDRTWRSTSIWPCTADLRQYTEIILQDIPELTYTLNLFVDEEEKELQRKDNRTWALAQRLYALSPHHRYSLIPVCV